jgi:hypothetical protein
VHSVQQDRDFRKAAAFLQFWRKKTTMKYVLEKKTSEIPSREKKTKKLRNTGATARGLREI